MTNIYNINNEAQLYTAFDHVVNGGTFTLGNAKIVDLLAMCPIYYTLNGLLRVTTAVRYDHCLFPQRHNTFRDAGTTAVESVYYPLSKGEVLHYTGGVASYTNYYAMTTDDEANMLAIYHDALALNDSMLCFYFYALADNLRRFRQFQGRITNTPFGFRVIVEGLPMSARANKYGVNIGHKLSVNLVGVPVNIQWIEAHNHAPTIHVLAPIGKSILDRNSDPLGIIANKDVYYNPTVVIDYMVINYPLVIANMYRMSMLLIDENITNGIIAFMSDSNRTASMNETELYVMGGVVSTRMAMIAHISAAMKLAVPTKILAYLCTVTSSPRLIVDVKTREPSYNVVDMLFGMLQGNVGNVGNIAKAFKFIKYLEEHPEVRLHERSADSFIKYRLFLHIDVDRPLTSEYITIYADKNKLTHSAVETENYVSRPATVVFRALSEDDLHASIVVLPENTPVANFTDSVYIFYDSQGVIVNNVRKTPTKHNYTGFGIIDQDGIRAIIGKTNTEFASIPVPPADSEQELDISASMKALFSNKQSNFYFDSSAVERTASIYAGNLSEDIIGDFLSYLQTLTPSNKKHGPQVIITSLDDIYQGYIIDLLQESTVITNGSNNYQSSRFVSDQNLRLILAAHLSAQTLAEARRASVSVDDDIASRNKRYEDDKSAIELRYQADSEVQMTIRRERTRLDSDYENDSARLKYTAEVAKIKLSNDKERYDIETAEVMGIVRNNSTFGKVAVDRLMRASKDAESRLRSVSKNESQQSMINLLAIQKKITTLLMLGSHLEAALASLFAIPNNGSFSKLLINENTENTDKMISYSRRALKNPTIIAAAYKLRRGTSHLSKITFVQDFSTHSKIIPSPKMVEKYNPEYFTKMPVSFNLIIDGKPTVDKLGLRDEEVWLLINTAISGDYAVFRKLLAPLYHAQLPHQIHKSSHISMFRWIASTMNDNANAN